MSTSPGVGASINLAGLAGRMNKVKRFIFNLIRKYFWKDYDPNEEFNCGWCGREMYHRYLYCSQVCSDLSEAHNKTR